MGKFRKPRCFVAMAFDYEDTDKIYDLAIHPVLKRNGVIPIIINRKDNNNDINYQIIEDLNECDFCIADLTYTRPSVYFEAGYAQRHVEVIYTVRKDHLNKNQPDDKRVHFDLQMKPLISWKAPSDKTFSIKLERRLKRTVLKSFAKRARISKKLEREKEIFTSLPYARRLGIMRRKAIYAARQNEFMQWAIEDSEVGLMGTAPWTGRTYLNPAKYANRDAIFIGKRSLGTRVKFLTIMGRQSITLANSGRIVLPFSWNFYYPEELRQDERNSTNVVEEHHIVFTIKSIPESRIMTALSNVHKSKRGFYKYQSDKIVSLSKVPGKGFIYFLSGIDSETKLRDNLSKVMDLINE